MKRKNLKTYAFILVSVLTVLSSCETSARYIGSNEWSGSVNQVSPHPNWLPIGQKEVDSSNWWYMTNLEDSYSGYEGIYLYEDITLTSDDYAFWQNSGSNVTLCLHGWTINGVGSSVETYSDGGVISVGSTSTFTIQDCLGGGKIQANKSVESGGVIKVNEGATLNLEGGSLTGGSATYDGGAIYSYKGIVNIKGGSISSNTADKGAGIYNEGGTLSISGGTIESNSATSEGGGVYSGPHVDESTSPTTVADATFTMTGGTIKGNSASDGAGIYSEGDLSLTASSSSSITITGNTALYDAGGVKFNKFGGENHNTQEQATIYLGGNVFIYDNYTCDGNSSLLTGGATTEYNLELSSLSLITFSSDSLGSESKIGITYLGLYGDTYQISTNSDSNAINYLSVDDNSDYSDYYTIVSENSENLELVYKTGVGDSTNTIVVTLEFTFYYQGSVDTSFPTEYGELYIVGDWDNYVEKTDLDYDENTYTFSITLKGLTVDIHYYELHLSYQINYDDDPLYNYDQDGQLSFKIPVSEVNSTSVTLSINLELDQKLEEYIPESGKIEKANCTVVFRWWSLGNPLDPQTLEWADMYVYSNLNGVDSDGEEIWEWSKCSVEEIDNISYYTLNLENIEAKQYEYSAALIYNYEEIPDISEVDSDWWTAHRVDYNDNPGINSQFTPSKEYIDDGVVYVDHDAKQSYLSYILPESGYQLNDSVTMSLDLTYDGESVIEPNGGSYYFTYGFHGQSGWPDFKKLVYDEDTGRYSITLNGLYDENTKKYALYASTYEFDIVFMYDKEYEAYQDGEFGDGYTHQLLWDYTYTFHYNDGGLTKEATIALSQDPTEYGHDLVLGDSGTLTIYFSITQWDVVYEVGQGYNLDIMGDWDSWGSWYLCTYDYSYVAGEQIYYRAVLPITKSGNYDFKIVRCSAYEDPKSDWSNVTEIVESNGGNACMYISSADIAAGYTVQYFYVDGGDGNWQGQS